MLGTAASRYLWYTTHKIMSMYYAVYCGMADLVSQFIIWHQYFLTISSAWFLIFELTRKASIYRSSTGKLEKQ